MMSPVTTSLLNFTLASTMFTISPGVGAALVLRSAIRGGHALGMGAVCGIVLSQLLWGIWASLGLCALLAVSPTAYTILKWAGALYLAWLGLQMIFRPNDALEGEALALAEPEARMASAQGHDSDRRRLAWKTRLRTFWQGVRRGLTTDQLSPETGVFVVSFFPQFIPHGSNVVEFTMLLTLILMVEALIFLGALVFLTVPLGHLLARPAIGRWIDRVTGVMFLYFAFSLAMATAPH
ncbi:LysE family translocator [Oecophyllibacter saccharovorans]|uniref:LysE family translocator n=1 Tax=Oecophyllibacter saccharovorans TaxID=2558360 RepID=UPI00116EDC95|nr:LysE family translocator [Oecophyllibacter saccharovorans]TPW35283.1 LysE family translocator [Oecophyllibacter saccharovorans]